jgi:type I restriction enzyme S subunit
VTRRAVLVRDIAQFVMGQAPPGKEVNSAGVGMPFFRSGEFGSIRPETVAWTTKPLKNAKSTDVFICVVGANAGEVNRGADGAIGRSIGAIRASEEVDSDYLYYFFKSREPVLRSAAQGSAQAVLSRDDLGRLPIELPPLAEQRAIAGVLGALDDKIESNRRISYLIEEEARTFFRCRFDISPRAAGVALGQLVEVNPIRQLSNKENAIYVGMADLPTSSALIERWGRRDAGSGQRFTNGDILLARITPCLENGKTALVDILKEGEVAWGSTEYIVFTPKEPVSKEWVYCLTRSEEFVEFAVRNMTGTSGRQRCSASAFVSYHIAEPDYAQLRDFGLLFEPGFRRMGKARDESRVLSSLRDVLLPELLSGRLRVRDAERVVEDAV